MCQALDEMIQDGIQQGEMRKAKEMSISMAELGIPVEKIAGAARVSVELVREWLRSYRICNPF